MTTIGLGISLPLIIGIIAAIILIGIIASGYVKAPPDTAYVISGFKKEPRILIGRAGIKIPFLERLDKLLLKQVTIDVKTEDYIPTLDFINIKVDAVVKVRVSTEPDMIRLAMRNFLNKSVQDIMLDLQDSLQGNMKEIIGAMSLKDINNNRDAFGNEVQTKAQVDMKKLGVEIISCNIQNVTDRNGLIEDMGMDNTSKIKKEAAIAKAEADRDIAIAQAEADKQANDARVKAQAVIAEKNNELYIKQAELKKQSDTKKAEADAAYGIQQQEQRRTVETATVNADIARQEREVELKARQVEVTEKALEAEIKKKAEAEKFAAQQRADAELYKRQKEAEAKQFEIERDAEAKKALAEAELVTMQKEAEGIRARGEAEAAAIQAKALAEAEGMEKKAAAYQKYNNAAMAEMLIQVLPDIAGKIAEPLQQIDKITIIGGSDNNGVDNVAGNVPAVMAKLFASMKETTGIDLGEIIKADTYDAKVNRNINITGLEKDTISSDQAE
ncbi:MAG: SPFH domain-containing protein [Oliverpabstia sp.]|nr:SPFH domain-containing protein [Lachnospiraceae bacterium]MDY5026823.1 SPFH domain-containing protein [Oliverpabstia sp.]